MRNQKLHEKCNNGQKYIYRKDLQFCRIGDPKDQIFFVGELKGITLCIESKLQREHSSISQHCVQRQTRLG